MCHQFNNEGKDLAPNLTGMGLHGPGELLVHILDPNRMVEENYMAVSIETTDGSPVDGRVSWAAWAVDDQGHDLGFDCIPPSQG